MKANTLRILCLCFCVTAVQAIHAQGPPPPGGAGPGAGPHAGMPGVPPPQQRDERHTSPASRQPGDASQPRNALLFGPVGRWWDDKSVVSSIDLSRQQQKKMDAIFDSNRTAILTSYKAFLRAQAHLDALNKAARPDQAQVFAAIDAVNQARSDLQKAASAMLIEIRNEMNPDQIDKIEKLQ